MVISGKASDAKYKGLTGLAALIFWPFISLFYGLRNYRYPIGKFLIVVLYGHAAFFYHFDFNRDLDVVRHAERLKATEGQGVVVIQERVINLFGSEEYKPDLFQPTIEFIVSRFTADYRIYFLVLGLIMGGFLVTYLDKIYLRYLQNPDIYLWLLFFLVIVLVPPYRVAGFRGIVAMLFFLFAIYKARVDGERKYHFLILLTPLIHFGYLVVVPFYYITLLIGARFYVYFIMIVSAFLLRDVVPSYVGLFGLDVEGELGNRIRGYSSQNYIENFNESRTGVLPIIRYQMHWTVVAFVVIFMLLYRKIRRCNTQTKHMFAMTLALLTLLVAVVQLEVVFVRFSIPFVLLSCLVVCMIFSDNHLRIGRVTKVFICLIFAFNFIVMARKSIEFTGAEVLMPNLIFSFVLDIETTVLDLLNALI